MFDVEETTYIFIIYVSLQLLRQVVLIRFLLITCLCMSNVRYVTSQGSEWVENFFLLKQNGICVRLSRPIH